MNKLLALLLTIAAMILHLLFGTPRADAHGHSSSVSVSTSDDDVDTLGCEGFHVTIDGREALRAAETIHLTRSDLAVVKARMRSGAGIHVLGSNRDDYEITLCKAAADTASLDRITLSHRDGELSLHGPEGDRWTAYLLVKAPQDSGVDLEGENGPVDVRNISGAIRVRTENGPLTLERCDADIEAITQNGPISFSGSGGQVSLKAENGPLTIDLEGRRWTAGELTARTQNGPLSLSLSDAFQSGVVVQASGYSPFSCKASACDRADKTWDESTRRISFGNAETVIRLSTVNGPISIRSPKNGI